MIADHNQIESPSKLVPHRTLTEFYPAPAQRAGFVSDLFDRAARDYDWLSAAMSFGTDRRYRRRALGQAGLRPGMRVLDVATGTGLVAQAALDLGIAPGNLIGIDPSLGMLAENRRRRSIRLMRGLGERLPFRDSAFDFVVMGYALRHVEDLAILFAEFHRVLRIQGRVLFLEITRPPSQVGLALLRFYMGKLLPLLARLGRRRRDSAKLLEYYWATIEECVPPEAIVSSLAAAGFGAVERRTSASVLSEFIALKR